MLAGEDTPTVGTVVSLVPPPLRHLRRLTGQRKRACPTVEVELNVEPDPPRTDAFAADGTEVADAGACDPATRREPTTRAATPAFGERRLNRRAKRCVTDISDFPPGTSCPTRENGP